MRAAFVLGCLDGLVIALLAFGVVLVYKAERFVNLANAQLGLVPAILLAKVVLDAGLNWYVAFILAIALGAATGAACRLYLISRVEQASRTALMITTLGVSQLLLALVLFEWVGPDRFRLRDEGYPFPFDVFWKLDALAITARHVLTLALVPTVLIGLAVWLRASSFGRAMRAAASNPTAARLAGVDVRRTATVAWTIVGGLSALAAVLTAPGGSVFEMQSLTPELLFLSLGAAALAGFTSLPGAVIAGLGLGIVQGVAAHVGHSAGVGLTAVFAAVIGGLVVRSFASSTPTEPVRVERSEEPFRVPAAITDRWFVRSWVPPLIATVIAVALPFLPWLGAPHRTFVLALFAVYGVATMSLTLLTGWGGQVSLGHFAFVGVGAFTAARLIPHGWSLLATMIAAAGVGAAAAIIVGLPSARSKGMSLTVTTLGFALIGPAWLFDQPWVAPGSANIAAAYEFGVGRLVTQRSVYFAALAVLVVVGLGLVRLRGSNAGRSILAVRDNERSAAMLGLSPVAVRLATFAASGGLAAIAGVLWLAVNRSVGPANFDPGISTIILSAAVIGGISYVRGAIIGALGAFGLPLLFESPIEQLLPDSYQLQLLLAGFGLITVQMVNPGGIASARRRTIQNLLERIAARSERHSPSLPTAAASRALDGHDVQPDSVRSRAAARSGAEALAARDVRVTFGGVHAVDSVALEVRRGEIVGLIGANGAGKTAFLNAICGLVPANGTVTIYGQDVSAFSPTRRAHAGVGRGFQDATLFPALTVRETIELALGHEHPTGVFGAVVGTPWVRLAQRSVVHEATGVIERFGLGAWADVPVDRLSTGVRHICEIAALVAARPDLLILDEPTSGVAQAETEAFGPLIRQAAQEADCAVLVVEHDMRLMMSLADRIYCLERGRVIAHGAPADIQRDPVVIASYLGMPRRRPTAKKKAAVLR